MTISESIIGRLISFASGAVLTTIEANLSIDFNYEGELYTLIGVCKSPIALRKTDDKEHYLEYDCSIRLHRDVTYEVYTGILLNRGLASYLREESISSSLCETKLQ